MSQNSKPGKHLPASHPALQKVRDFIRMEIQSKRIHPRLIGNFDQVWSVQYQPSKRTLQCRDHCDDLAKHMSWRRLRHQIELSLDLPLTENLAENRYHSRPGYSAEGVTGGAAGCAPVECWRVPRTLTTLSWSDGSVGRGYVTLRSDSISEKDHDLANQDHDTRLVWGWGTVSILYRSTFNTSPQAETFV